MPARVFCPDPLRRLLALPRQAGVDGGGKIWIDHMKSDSYERIYEAVRCIPKGRVATYGQIAELVGLQNGARQVGYALSALGDDTRVPWHRVVNAKGQISARWDPNLDDNQRDRLEEEGVEFDNSGTILLSRYRWNPRRRRFNLSRSST